MAIPKTPRRARIAGRESRPITVDLPIEVFEVLQEEARSRRGQGKPSVSTVVRARVLGASGYEADRDPPGLGLSGKRKRISVRFDDRELKWIDYESQRLGLDRANLVRSKLIERLGAGTGLSAKIVKGR